LFDDHATVSVPFWHDDDAADRAPLPRMWAYIDVLCDVSGYEVFDLQLDRVITRGAFDEGDDRYAKAAARVRSINRPTRRTRPWWKFW
jgi:hypothetical protein